MKNVLTSLTILCLLFTLLLIGYKTSVKASPNTIYVPTADYPTIQEAINKANPRDTIFVHNGTYYENLVVNKTVSLVGEDKETTIIDGGEKSSVIFITVSNVKIKGFTIQKSGTSLYDSGILIDHSSGNDISHNKITNNYHGIYLSYSRATTISSNIIHSNSINGISVDSSSDNLLLDNNVFSNNVNGIRLSSSSTNIISRNNIHSNKVNGIRLSFSSGNIISGNNISANINYGIRLDFSINNIIYHNNFDNTDQVLSDSVNVWDRSSEGNYWSDYTEQDLNKDGIGDTPYIIDSNNKDNNPLMGNFSDFKITLKDKTYHATTICNSTISNLRFEVGGETGNKILSFNVIGENGTVGFCRVMIPTELMNYPYIVLVDEEEIATTLLDVSNKTHAHLYFAYAHSSHTVTIISSRLLYLYNELLDQHTKLQIDFYNLNSTYHELLDNYLALLGNYTQLLESYDTLNASYQQHLLDYLELQGNHTSLLLEHSQNIQNLTYVFIATTAALIIAAVYLSTHAHRRKPES